MVFTISSALAPGRIGLLAAGARRFGLSAGGEDFSGGGAGSNNSSVDTKARSSDDHLSVHDDANSDELPAYALPEWAVNNSSRYEDDERPHHRFITSSSSPIHLPRTPCMPLTPGGGISHRDSTGKSNTRHIPTARTQPYCGGKCVTTPDTRLALGTLILMIFPSVVFDGWTAPWICVHWPIGWAFALFAIALQFAVFGLFFDTAFSDPGIIPRMTTPINDPTSKIWHQHTTPVNPPKHQDITIQGHLFKMKYCVSCNLYRPPRCVHCSICDNCVDKFDHHCPWVGNCVGRRNYRSFFLFVVTTSTFITVMLISCPIKFVQCLQHQQVDLRQAFARIWGEAWDAAVLTIYCFALLWFVLGLTGYHLYLISTNQTTYEQIKGFFDEKLNPWDRGCLSNLLELLLRSRRKSFWSWNRSGEVLYTELVDEKKFSSSSQSGHVESGGIIQFCVNLLGGDDDTSSNRPLDRSLAQNKLFSGGGGSSKSLSNKNARRTNRSLTSLDALSPSVKKPNSGIRRDGRHMASLPGRSDDGLKGRRSDTKPQRLPLNKQPTFLSSELERERDENATEMRLSIEPNPQRSSGSSYIRDEIIDGEITRDGIVLQSDGVHQAAAADYSFISNRPRRHSEPTGGTWIPANKSRPDIGNQSVAMNKRKPYEDICSSCFNTVSECQRQCYGHSKSTRKITRASLQSSCLDPMSPSSHYNWRHRPESNRNDNNPSIFSSLLKMMGFAGKCFSQTDIGKMTCVLPD